MSVSSVDRPVSAPRQRMLDDMAMRGLRSDTQRDYIRVVRGFPVPGVDRIKLRSILVLHFVIINASSVEFVGDIRFR